MFSKNNVLEPMTFVLFGATGDLALLYLLPGLLQMLNRKVLPKGLRIVCVGRRNFNQEQYRQFLREKMRGKFSSEELQVFYKAVEYYQANFENPESFSGLLNILNNKKSLSNKHSCSSLLYYFATQPGHFEPLVKILKNFGLLEPCGVHERLMRVVVEKPFGSDLLSAKKLNKLLLTHFREEQIYRIDHYLGKETVQNLIVARFANDIFEPVWNKNHVDHIEISVLESLGLEGRASFYDAAGALRDTVQNHILQMLALVCMNRPDSINASDIQKKKLEVIKNIIPFNTISIFKNVVRGQYASGEGLDGYVQELGKKSNTETYVALKLGLNMPRWKGVPILLRTGKRMSRKVTEISVHFKKHDNTLFIGHTRMANVVTFRIQPDESVKVSVNNKIPGSGIRLHHSELEFGYKAVFSENILPAYERLLLDFIQADRSLFISTPEIEGSWRFIDSITKNWNEKNAPLYSYKNRSHGPAASAELLPHIGGSWWTK